jgi:hypothetical protein
LHLTETVEIIQPFVHRRDSSTPLRYAQNDGFAGASGWRPARFPPKGTHLRLKGALVGKAVLVYNQPGRTPVAGEILRPGTGTGTRAGTHPASWYLCYVKADGREEDVDIRVYDHEGKLRDLAYLRSRYGDFLIQEAAAGAGPAFKISALKEQVEAAAALVVKVTDKEGNPLDSIRVAWYWPDADSDPNAGPLGGVPPEMRPNRAVSGPTKENGDVGFGMGGGAYYWPSQGETGPHAAWIHGPDTRSDLILGLGMVAATNHNHFDIEYTRVEEDEPPPEQPPASPPETPEIPVEEIEAQLAKIEEALQAIRSLFTT